MEGNNQLILCHAEMMAALQMYVNHLMPESEAKVQSVKQKEDVFIVRLTKED